MVRSDGMETNDCREWAREHFGSLELGDARRTARIVDMACCADRRPGGRVLDVYQTSAARQGAYDFLENTAARSSAMVDGVGLAAASASEEHPYVLVSVDGSSLNIVDRARSKGFGTVGNVGKNARGLKVVTSYALEADGTPIGVLDQQWWLRGAPVKHDKKWRLRTTEQKETRYFNKALDGERPAPRRTCTGHKGLVSSRSRIGSTRDARSCSWHDTALVHDSLQLQSASPQ